MAPADVALTPSSPRLPSPPPPAEIQIGPQSPSMSGSSASRQVQEQTIIDAGSKRRIHPGTRAADFAAGPPLVPLNELDSAFQLQEHLAALHYYHTSSNTQPITRETARALATAPPGIDRTLWLYELCRFLIAQCNSLIVGFLFDTPPCSAVTCPEMRASEWQFLCAVHDAPKSCCAIDYCCHTLDWAANVVTNPKIFPSRFVLSPDAHDKGAAVKNLVNVFRRLHRIFAHAWFQHRGVFWSVEGQTGLYIFFKTVCDMYDLLPAENYKLPPEAEGLETTAPQPAAAGNGVTQIEDRKAAPAAGGQSAVAPTSIARPPRASLGTAATAAPTAAAATSDEDHILQPVGRTNTRRHIRSSPSTGSAVTTVMEQDEDDGSAAATSRLKEMHISAPETVEEESETAEVPAVVESSVEGQQDGSAQPEAAAEEKEEAQEAAAKRPPEGTPVGAAGTDAKKPAEAAEPSPAPAEQPDGPEQEKGVEAAGEEHPPAAAEEAPTPTTHTKPEKAEREKEKEKEEPVPEASSADPGGVAEAPGSPPAAAPEPVQEEEKTGDEEDAPSSADAEEARPEPETAQEEEAAPPEKVPVPAGDEAPDVSGEDKEEEKEEPQAQEGADEHNEEDDDEHTVIGEPTD